MPTAKRSKQLHARVRPHEMEAVEEVAEQLGKRTSEFVREATLDAVRRVRENETGPVIGSWRADVHERAET